MDGGFNALLKTAPFRDCKSVRANGIAGNGVRSLTPPLLAEHVLRQANHCFRQLRASCTLKSANVQYLSP